MSATTEVASVADEDSNDFRSWMKSMGYNAKQVSTAGELVGMSPSLAGHSSRGLRDLTNTERLAMSAATAGLPPWSPEKASEIEAVRALYGMLTNELAQAKVGSGEENVAIRTIMALIKSEAQRIASDKAKSSDEIPGLHDAIRDLLRAAQLPPSGR